MVGNETVDGFFFYLVLKEVYRYNDLYLLKIRGSIQKNETYLYLRKREALELVYYIIRRYIG